MVSLIATCFVSLKLQDPGIIFDSKFSFNHHINYIIYKSYTLKLLFTSYVRSHLEYAVSILRHSNQFYRSRIEVIQTVFLKFVLRSLKFEIPIPSFESRLKLINLKTWHTIL